MLWAVSEEVKVHVQIQVGGALHVAVDLPQTLDSVEGTELVEVGVVFAGVGSGRLAPLLLIIPERPWSLQLMLPGSLLDTRAVVIY